MKVKKLRSFVKELIPVVFLRRYVAVKYNIKWPPLSNSLLIDVLLSFLPFLFFKHKIYHSFPYRKIRWDDMPNFKKGRRNCILVAHESSRTGCPINTYSMLLELSKNYNVLVISLMSGPLDDDFRAIATGFISCEKGVRENQVLLEKKVVTIFRTVSFDFAIVNSVSSSTIIPLLTWYRIPSVVCVHEFAQYCSNAKLKECFLYGTKVIYSSRFCLEATVRKIGLRQNIDTIDVLPQGMSTMPRASSERISGNEYFLFNRILERKRTQGEVIVFGVGTVGPRKGVDLFIRAAAKIREKSAGKKVYFVWAGDGFNPVKNIWCKLLKAQIYTLGMENDIEFLGSLKFMDRFWELADVFLMPSILDPLPGVVLEAMDHGVPIICFDKASGYPEYFSDAELSDSCVVPYLDVDAFVQKASVFVCDERKRAEIGVKLRSLRRDKFDMRVYVDRILSEIPPLRNTFREREALFEGCESKNDFLLSWRAASAEFFGITDNSRVQLRCRELEFLSPVVYGLESSVPKPTNEKSSSEIKVLVGGNTGNLAFHYALDKVLVNKKEVLPWNCEKVVPDDAIGVFPCANQLGSHFDMASVSSWLDQHSTPMVAIGLGAQSRVKKSSQLLDYEIPYLSQGTADFVRKLAEHAPTDHPNITLRGEFSAQVIKSLGLSDKAEVLGCPTLFINENRNLGEIIEQKRKRGGRRVAFACGTTGWNAVLHNRLAELITKNDGAFVVQHNMNFVMAALGRYSELPSEDREKMRLFLRADLDERHFDDWFKHYGHVFFDIPEWMDFYRGFDFVVGPRIHGIMLALQAGVPGLCIAIDSRTTELCEKMKVPYVPIGNVSSGMDYDDFERYFQFDAKEFDLNRQRLAAKFCNFLKNNKLLPSEHLCGIAGMRT